MPAAKRNLRTRANAEIPATGRPSARVAHAALDARLDLALIGTFPASDPVAIGHTTGTEPPSRPVERGPVTIDVAEIERVRRHPERAPES